MFYILAPLTIAHKAIEKSWIVEKITKKNEIIFDNTSNSCVMRL